MNITDKEWEKWGMRDPYYGVISLKEFRKDKLDEDNRRAFFQSGQNYVQEILAKVRSHIDPEFQPRKILDFGCGVGRLVIPFSRLAASVTGIDVSESMLDEARKNCARESIENVELINSHDEDLSVIDDCLYDLVHSFIVFQHIPVRRGERILSAMLARLKPGGCGVLHFMYASVASNIIPATQKIKNWLRNRLAIAHWIHCLRRELAGTDPEMQMNAYNLNVLVMKLQSIGVKEMFIELQKDGDYLCVILYFQKPRQSAN